MSVSDAYANESAVLAEGAALGGLLGSLGLTVACAESCTGGLIARALTEIAGSSAWFDRGFVTYSNAAKQDLLGVTDEALQSHGAVSEVVAAQMAGGALSRARVGVALSVTGIAGPGGAVPGKPVGTVCFGWAIRLPLQPQADPLVWTQTRHFDGDRAAVRRQSAIHAMREALRGVSGAWAARPPIA